MEERTPLFWGCDFDPNPDIGGIRRKLMSVLQNQGKPTGRGPYDIYYDHQHLFRGDKTLFAGKYPCPSWLSATPDFSRQIYPETYRKFINDGLCRDFAFAFGQYITDHTPKDRTPVCLGVDHCLTGGIYQALAKRNSNTLLVVLDRHLDAISPYARNHLVGYDLEQAQKNQRKAGDYEYYGPGFRGNYDTGSFLGYLIENKLLAATNLLVFGNQDSPAPQLRSIRDERIAGYLREYDRLLETGAVIVPLREWRKQNFRAAHKQLVGVLAGRRVYLSVDVDVFDDILGQCARYNASRGAGGEEALRLLEWLGLDEAQLIGMDVMELDVNLLRENGVSENDAAAAMDTLLAAVFPRPERTV